MAQNDNIADITKIVNVSAENIQFTVNTVKVTSTICEIVQAVSQVSNFYAKARVVEKEYNEE